MAAAYLFHICQNHPFLDGNKQAATAAAISFLYINKIEWVISETKMENCVRAVSEGKMAKAEFPAKEHPLLEQFLLDLSEKPLPQN